jgi:hypothetical protein
MTPFGPSRHIGPLDPMAYFKQIIRHMPQLDTQDHERDNPYRIENGDRLKGKGLLFIVRITLSNGL